MTAGLTRGAVADLDRAADPVAAVVAMCERGREALMRAVSVTEAKDVLAAISTLEHAVKVRDMNQEAVIAASTLRIRAERRVGELLAAQQPKAGRPEKSSTATRISDVVTYDESSKFQRLAAVPAAKFERAVEKVAQQASEKGSAVTREAVIREIAPEAARTPSDNWKDGDRFKAACDRVAELADRAIDAIRWGHFPSGEAADVETTAMVLSLKSAREAIEKVELALRRRRGK